MENWSVQGLLDAKFNYSNKYEQAKIGDFLIKSRNIVNIEDDKEYNRVTVKINNNGVILRDTEKGVNIGTKKQYRANAGQFIISKIDARNGAFGIIPSELDNAIVTNDFPLFDVNTKKINPQFLLLITTTKVFIKFAQSCSSGTTNRQRMDIDMFLNQKIPLPKLEEQDKIVNNFLDKINNAEALKRNAEDLENKIELYFLSELGISINNKKQRVKSIGLQFVDYSNLVKWGLDFIGLKNNDNRIYKDVSINELCKISSGGTPSRSRKEYYEGGNIPWIKTGELNNEILFDTEEKITEEALKNSSAKLYKKGSIIIAMYGATIGKTAKLGVEASTNQACAVLFDIDNSMVITDYLWEYLQIQTDNLKKLAYGSAQPNLNAGIISNYPIPIPSIEKQKEILDKIISIKKEVKTLNEKSVELKKEAEIQFEKAIFNS
ncbi:MAG: restriction endonuclease subunit S [Bacteroidia bacterium]|nr:restriction endonuclease subunit S [Bacteroidia bacterium]